MSSELSKVSPGQIISSDLMNAIIDRLVLLQGKVETLESEFAELNKLTIIEPNPSRTLYLGDDLYIAGTGFGAPWQNHIIVENQIFDHSRMEAETDCLSWRK